MKWISIKTQMPPNTDQLAVLINGRVATIAKYEKEIGFIEDGLDVECVTHWCLLPELPLKNNGFSYFNM